MKLGKLIFGAIAGLTAGLLFAPKSGKDLRKEFSSEFKKGGYGEKTVSKNAKIVGEDVSKTAQEVYNLPEVQKGIKYTQKEADKLIKRIKKEMNKQSKEWGVKAKETIEEIKKNVVKKKPLIKAAKKSHQIPIKKG